MKIKHTLPKLPFHTRLILAIARLEPSGLVPYAPGTFGSLFALLLAPFIFLPLPLFARIISLIALFFFGAWASSYAEKILQKKDPSSIVIDELVGQWVVLLMMPQVYTFSTFAYLQAFLAFLFFRLFDIFKPYPIGKSESLFPDGFGVMIDDVLAGLYALLLLFLVNLIFA